MDRASLVKALRLLLSFFKKRGLFILPLSALLYLVIFWYAPDILAYLEEKYHQRFVFFTLAEPIVSLLKFSFTLFIILLFPVLYLGLLSIFGSLLTLKKRFWALFYLLGLLFFYGGVLFAYFITLPYGIKFLISFKTQSLEPSIALSHFVNFFSFFLLAFGFIFELPLILSLLTLLRILRPKKVVRYRKEIFFFIVVLAAVITPTPDAINMSLLALPLYALFELGLFLGRLLERTNILSQDTLKGPQPE